MKLTQAVVKQFEQDQKEHGTQTALFNFAYMLAADILHGIGVTRIRTTVKAEKR